MKDSSITVGENIKRIRKDLNLKQHELAGKDITRNLISLIENDKTPIYHNVANIISINVNRILYERGLDIYIQPEDILNPERYEARKQANQYIEKLTKRLEKKDYQFQLEELNEIENFLNKWNFIDKKVKIYELLGDIFYNAKDSNREHYYYLKALEISYEHPFLKERYKIILKLVSNYILTEKFDEAIKLCNFALSTQDDIPSKYKGAFHYNCGLAYYYKKEYGNCLNELIDAKYYVTTSDYREIKKILLLEGICNCELKNYNSAIRSYNKLLEVLEENCDPEELSLTYINIAQTYIEMEDMAKVMEFYTKANNSLQNISEQCFELPKILFSMVNICSYLNETNLCETYLLDALCLSENHKDKNLFSNILSKLLDFYAETDQYSKVHMILEAYSDKIYSIGINKDFIVILKILYSLIQQNNNLDALQLIKNLLNKEVQ